MFGLLHICRTSHVTRFIRNVTADMGGASLRIFSILFVQHIKSNEIQSQWLFSHIFFPLSLQEVRFRSHVTLTALLKSLPSCLKCSCRHVVRLKRHVTFYFAISMSRFYVTGFPLDSFDRIPHQSVKNTQLHTWNRGYEESNRVTEIHAVYHLNTASNCFLSWTSADKVPGNYTEVNDIQVKCLEIVVNFQELKKKFSSERF